MRFSGMEQQEGDVLWVAICAVLVFLMQGGFLCVEAGLCRSKNFINIAIKNIIDMGATVLVFWSIGFALMFGATSWGWIGSSGFFTRGIEDDFWHAVFFLFQAMFAGTAVTIVSGAVAERMRITAYFCASAVIAGLIYPVYGHWVWGGMMDMTAVGWLAKLGFADFAGSTVVHSIGGWVALAGLIHIGPRLGRFAEDGTPQEIPGANIPLAALGVLILWFGWFGFNGGSTLAFNETVPKVIVNTLLGGAAGTVACVLYAIIRGEQVQISGALNGVLAGAVGVTAGANVLSAPLAILAGGVGGLVALGAAHLLARLRIDDAVDAIPVHLGAGIWGTLAVGLLGDLELLGTGLDRGQQIGVQALGIAVAGAWAFSVAWLAFWVINQLMTLRVTPEEEKIGLNVSEHGAHTETLDFLVVMQRQEETGDLSLRAPEEPFTEVGQIALRYNRVMARLEETVAITNAIIQSSMDAIVTIGRDDLRILSINPAAASLYAVDENSVRGEPVTALMHFQEAEDSDEAFAVGTLLRELAESRRRADVWTQRADGAFLPVQLVVTEAKAGSVAFYAVTIHDQHDRLEAEADLRLGREQHEALLGSIHEAVVMLDEQAMVREMNAAANVLFGIGSDLAEGASAADLFFPPDQRDRVRQGLLGMVARDDDPALGRPLKTRIRATPGGTGEATQDALLLVWRFRVSREVRLMLLFRTTETGSAKPAG